MSVYVGCIYIYIFYKNATNSYSRYTFTGYRNYTILYDVVPLCCHAQGTKGSTKATFPVAVVLDDNILPI